MNIIDQLNNIAEYYEDNTFLLITFYTCVFGLLCGIVGVIFGAIRLWVIL